MWHELITAALFYMPFVITIGFAVFVFVVGLICICSGTIFFLLFAAYGSYAFLRDVGLIQQCISYVQSKWKYGNTNVLDNMKNTFQLRNTEQIPSGQALYICSPHGMVGYSWFFHFCYGLSEWPKSSQRPYFAIHSIFFRIPFARDIFLASRCIEASDAQIRKTLQEGHSVALILGGVEEMTYAGQDIVKIVMKKRRGYIRLAKERGIPIVPVYTAGENELFAAESSWIWRTFSNAMYKSTGFQFPLPSWTSMKNFAKIIQAPLDTPIETFFLKPIETQKKDEQTIRNECIRRLEHFFSDQKIRAEIIA